MAIARGRPRAVRKTRGLQGPIDDAFMEGFAVRGTGQPWNAAVHDYARKRFDTLKKEFAKWARGDIRAKDDSAVSADDIAKYNLILFGDPGSNGLIQKSWHRCRYSGRARNHGRQEKFPAGRRARDDLSEPPEPCSATSSSTAATPLPSIASPPPPNRCSSLGWGITRSSGQREKWRRPDSSTRTGS